MKTADLISPTLLARKIMYRFGKRTDRVFTNNYKKCRTVKCYSSPSANYNMLLVSELYNFLRDAGVIGHTIQSNRGAIIVRIPK